MITQMMFVGKDEPPLPFDLSSPGITYTGKSFSVTGQDNAPESVAFSADGSKFFMVGAITRRLFIYTCTTPWDLSTASYSGNNYDPAPTGVFEALWWRPNGQSFFMCNGNQDRVYQWTCSAWDPTTASLLGSVSVSAQETSVHGVAVSNDGTNMYILGLGSERIYQYTLSTPWNVTTATYSGKSFAVGSFSDAQHDIFLSFDGSQLLISARTGGDASIIHQIGMSTPFDISTASYSSVFFNPSEDGNLEGIYCSPDQRRMFTISSETAGGATDLVREYSLG